MPDRYSLSFESLITINHCLIAFQGQCCLSSTWIPPWRCVGQLLLEIRICSFQFFLRRRQMHRQRVRPRQLPPQKRGRLRTGRRGWRGLQGLEGTIQTIEFHEWYFSFFK